MALQRIRKMVTLPLLLILIHQSIFTQCLMTIGDYDYYGDGTDSGDGIDSNDLDSDAKSGFTKVDDSTGLISVSDNCSDYGIDELPHPRFILLGKTGVGKSSLANQLLGRNHFHKSQQLFSVGHLADSHTLDITYVVGNWLGDGPCFTIIDTPGTSDSEGRDYEHALAMANIMKDQIKSVDIFLLCFSGQDSRFDQATIDLLKLYESIFSKQMWNHAITEVTYWKHDRKSWRGRTKYRQINEKKRHKQWNAQYKQELGVTIDIPSVYIDPVLPIFDAEEKEHLSERETKAFQKYTDELFEYGNNSEPFFCAGNCKAPNGYFLGNPWIKSNNITILQGEKVVIKCQIWNGIQGKASENVQWTHNGDIIYEKITDGNYGNETSITSTDVWGSNAIFDEILSPGEGHYTDFIIQFESLEESMEGVYTCENGRDTDENVADLFMRVHGTWGEWGAWGHCSKSCLDEDNQMGIQERVREEVPPINGGDPVNPLDGKDTQICAGDQGPLNPILCPKDFSWNEWTEWSECSPRCGDGTRYRMRFCNQGSNGGEMCPLSLGNNLSEKEEEACKIKECADCILLGWEEWSQCSKTCMKYGVGTRTRKRKTQEADPNDPKCHLDDHSKSEMCNTVPCAADGGWSVWSIWYPCSAQCGGGEQIRTRTCTQPPPQHGGKLCDGNGNEKQTCNPQECVNPFPKIDGGWTVWSIWFPCSAQCGGGERYRMRTCTQPPPQNGGKQCDGNGSEKETCNPQKCANPFPKIDGRWTNWSIWFPCSAQCGGGERVRTRTCTQPSPQNGGKHCDGNGSEKEACNTPQCEEPDCDCSYSGPPGGCKITKPTPEGWKCHCKYLYGWTCGGESKKCVGDCPEPNCKSLACCKIGGGDCGGY